LIGFVDAARSHVEGTQQVEIVPRPNDTEWVPEEFAVELPALAQPPAVIDRQQANRFRAALQEAIDNEGDARSVIQELIELRDALH